MSNRQANRSGLRSLPDGEEGSDVALLKAGDPLQESLAGRRPKKSLLIGQKTPLQRDNARLQRGFAYLQRASAGLRSAFASLHSLIAGMFGRANPCYTPLQVNKEALQVYRAA